MTVLATSTPAELYVGDDLSAAGYSDKEINLIGYCWQDAEEVNKSKTSLAMHLWELKQEMDVSGSKAAGGNGGGSTKSRFWAAFEAGHLPLTGDSGRTSVKTSLAAVEFLNEAESGRLAGAPADRLRNLAPSTLERISWLDAQALGLVYKSLESTDYIGIAAVRLLGSEKQQDVFDKLFAWVEDHPSKPVTPQTIRTIRAEVEAENQPAEEQVIDLPQAPTLHTEEAAAAFNELMDKVRQQAPERERQARIDVVKEELARPERERHQRAEERVTKYNTKLLNAHTAIHDLLVFLQGVDRIDGTQYLDEMRRCDVRGLVTVHDDLARIKKMGEELMALARLANSSNPPTGIDMTTFNVEADSN